MYSLVYKIYFALKRAEKKKRERGKTFDGILRKALDYTEWFYNVPVRRYYEKHPSKKFGLNRKPREEKIIISLTSFPKRIDTLWLVIETLLRQSMKPDEIILWLADTQFDGVNSLPEKLLAQRERGLTIRFCDDLRSHKKYFYTMQEYPDDLIVLADDDIFYTKDLVKNLYRLHKKYPEEIVCMSAAIISEFNLPPSKWVAPKCKETTEHSYKAQAYTGAGTLFPKNSFDNNYVFSKELISQLCPYADDLWLKYMSLRKNKKTTAIYKNRYMPVMIYGTSESGLWYINGQDGKNDVQWNALLDYFKDESIEEIINV